MLTPEDMKKNKLHEGIGEGRGKWEPPLYFQKYSTNCHLVCIVSVQYTSN